MKTSYRELDYAYGEAMQKLRNAIGLTQAGLADRLCVSWRTVAGWEAGSSYPRAEHLKELIALAVQQRAFSAGHEAEEIRILWKVAHQKIFLDERWLSALLDQQSSPQGQVLWLRPRVESQSVQETMIGAPATEQESVDEELTEVRMPSDQSSVVPSLHLTGLDAVACQPLGQSHERLPEAGTAVAPPPLPNGSFPQTPSKTNANRPRRKWLVSILIALVIGTIIGSAGTFLFLAREQADKTAAAQAYPGYLSGHGTLAFFDPLSQAGRWKSTSNAAGGSCQFTGGAYHVSEQRVNYFSWCLADGIFGNFAFEVQLTVTQGDCGGMTLRDDGKEHFYKFIICQDGRYKAVKYTNDNTTIKLHNGNSTAIRTGPGQQNKMAVVASNSTMIFYVNEQQIDQEQDSGPTQGKIALTAGPYDNSSHDVTEAVYSNARLWTL